MAVKALLKDNAPNSEPSLGFKIRVGGGPQCYQMELRWRFRDLIKCFNIEKSFNMRFAFILNEFGRKMNKELNRVYKFGLNT